MKKFSTYLWPILTAIIAIWGILEYAAGGAMAWFGITLSFEMFLVLVALFIVTDIFTIRNAIKNDKAKEQAASEIQVQSLSAKFLESPCNVTLTRVASMVGAAMGVKVLLNGSEVGVVKNGKTLEFTTNYDSNILTVVYNADGTTNSISFIASPGGNININLKYTNAVLTIA